MRGGKSIFILGSLCAGIASGQHATAADQAASDVAQMEQRCEQARQAKLAPIREAEIAKCKSDQRSDPAYCDRFWADYGDAHRAANGRWMPRLFDDLPECVAAAKARRENNVK